MGSTSTQNAFRITQQPPSSVVYGIPVDGAAAYNNRTPNPVAGAAAYNSGGPNNGNCCCGCLVKFVSAGICFLFFLWLLSGTNLLFTNGPEFYVSSMLVSPFNVTQSGIIAANWSIGLLANDSSYILGGFEVSLFYDNKKYGDNKQYLCDAKAADLMASGKDPGYQKHLLAGPKACWQPLTTAIAPEDIRSQVSYFDVYLEGRYRYVKSNFERSFWPGKGWRKISLNCAEVEVWFPSNGTQGIMLGGMKKCE